MNDTKNEPVIEFAKNFIDDCSNFEIKNLDYAKSKQNNSPDISLFSDFVKKYLNPIEEEQNQNHRTERACRYVQAGFGECSCTLSKFIV